MVTDAHYASKHDKRVASRLRVVMGRPPQGLRLTYGNYYSRLRLRCLFGGPNSGLVSS